MGSITPGALLVDLQTYHHHSSALAYLTASALFTSAIRPRPRHRLTPAAGAAALSPARRPRDRFPNAPPPAPAPAAESTSAAVSELDAFLELVPPRMRGRLAGHGEIGALIELVMDLGRKPIARFPSGDWVISEQPVKLEDLRHAISMVTPPCDLLGKLFFLDVVYMLAFVILRWGKRAIVHVVYEV